MFCNFLISVIFYILSLCFITCFVLEENFKLKSDSVFSLKNYHNFLIDILFDKEVQIENNISE